MEENLVISDIEAPPVVHAGVGVGVGAGSEEQQQQQLVVTEIPSIEELGYGTEQLLELNNSYYGSEIAQLLSTTIATVDESIMKTNDTVVPLNSTEQVIDSFYFYESRECVRLSLRPSMGHTRLDFNSTQTERIS
ncbi:hypothetical protein pipiens_010926 [Culex pipiens pipiens]|uniref:Uncharacterized protein n=1 Tax=Culex pipiens pipiens TaxID=38569 RepID=A0ABD1D8A8_CULPP